LYKASVLLLTGILAPLALLAQTPITHSWFAMDVNRLTDPWPSAMVQMATWRTLGSGIDWQSMNPQPGVYDWTAFDEWKAKSAAGKTNIMFTLFKTPDWAASAPIVPCNMLRNSGPAGFQPPDDVAPDGTGTDQHVKDFVNALLDHVGRGAIRFMEVWNEPDDKWCGTIAQLIRVEKDVYTLTRQFDPNIQIISPPPVGLPKKWFTEFISAGAAQYADIIGFHGYTYPNPPEFVDTLIDTFRTILLQNGVSKPLYDTEGSYGAHYFAESDAWKTAFLGRLYLLQMARGVGQFSWYGWDFSESGQLYSTTMRSITPIGIAYQQIVNWTLGKIVYPGGIGTRGTYFIPIVGNGHKALVLWNPMSSVVVHVPVGYTQIRDLTGASRTVYTGEQLIVGGSPILLE
jgi:hypothetical protein